MKNMRIVTSVAGACCLFVLPFAALADVDYPIQHPKVASARVTRGFWFDRIATNCTATLKSVLAKCNETPRIANFTNAANRAWGTFGGKPFDDSDVYKMMEGVAYMLAAKPDSELRKYMEWLIGEIAKAQEPDGYLYTARTLGFAHWKTGKAPWEIVIMGPTRWSNVPSSHELYNVGHMYEAAVAWHQATRRDDFLRIAEKNAALLLHTFGTGEFQLRDAPGHEEIELALCKLYRETGKKQYLGLAKHFIDMRGHGEDRREADVYARQENDWKLSAEMALPGAYHQHHMPFVRQREAVGHAVRAGYLYCGAVDVAALTGDKEYLAAITAIWENVVGRKLHLTGGIGARRSGEAFGADYELPNESAYLETCAAIANALWNDRMFRFTGESKYVDVLERTIYNGFVSGISLSGDEYFYQNPLAKKDSYRRSKWFGCSCCPGNDIRFLPQIPSLAYATDGKGTIYWNLFMEGDAEMDGVRLHCETDYPWNGKAVLKVLAGARFASLKIRIPGWARGRPVPSDLYGQTEPSNATDASVAVNGLSVDGVPGVDGYLAIRREWKAGDMVELILPMPVKRIRAHKKVVADRGRLAVERGPIVYCAEGFDNGGKAFDAELPADATFADDVFAIGDKCFPALEASNGLKLIPYCLWGNRQPGNQLETWFRE